MLQHHNRIFIHSFAPILIGITIYAFWRGLHFIDPTEKIFPLFSATNIPKWIKYNLPDGLWLYALLSVLLLIWEEKISRHFVAWLLLAIIFSFLTEALQAYHLIPGTFDWNDLLAYLIAVTFCFLNFNKQFLFTIKNQKK
jgi:hypothetical protein